MTYQEQINLVRPVARKVLEFDPSAVIMGGAPRDWYLKQEARDVDFFIVPAAKRSLDWNWKQLERELGVQLTPVVGEGYEDAGMDDPWEEDKPVEFPKEIVAMEAAPARKTPIIAVREANIDDVQCQFVMVKDSWAALEEFPCSLSKFAITCRGLLFQDRFTLDRIEVWEAAALAKGVCYYKEGTKPAYLDKLKERYGFQFKPYEDGVEDLYGEPDLLQDKIILQAIKLEWNV